MQRVVAERYRISVMTHGFSVTHSPDILLPCCSCGTAATHRAPKLLRTSSHEVPPWVRCERCVCVCGSVRVWEGAVCALLPFRSASFLPGQAAAWKCKPFTTPSFWHTQTHISWDVWFKRAQMKPCLLSHRQWSCNDRTFMHKPQKLNQLICLHEAQLHPNRQNKCWKFTFTHTT